MLKKTFVVFIWLFFLAAAKGYALTSEASLNMAAGLGAGYYYLYPKDSQVKDYYKGAFSWRGFLEFKSSSGLSAIGEIGYYAEENKSSLAPRGTNLSMVPITAALAYRFFKDYAISPYIGAGLGLYTIKETDPDYTYLNTTKFGKHIFAGVNIYLSPDTIFKAELRDTIIDPVNSSLYYQVNFGGLSAFASLAVEWPLFGPEKDMSPEERALLRQEKLHDERIREQLARLNELEWYYQQQQWDERTYRRFISRDHLLNEINQTKDQLEQEQAKVDQLKQEQAQKRQQYLEQKAKLRQDKKDAATSPAPMPTPAP